MTRKRIITAKPIKVKRADRDIYVALGRKAKEERLDPLRAIWGPKKEGVFK